MKPRTQEKEFNVFFLFLGLMLGFLLGSTVIYWHTNRQTDRVLEETIEKVLTLFKIHSIHIETADDSILLVREKPTKYQTTDNANPVAYITLPADPITIAQDRLLYTKIVSLENHRVNISVTSRRLDSLLGNTSAQKSQLFFIEFWESPLNSKGYKMGKNKIMLYGIRSFDMVTLATYQGKTYLRYLNEYYPIEVTSTFKPLIPVNESFFYHDDSTF